MASPHLAGSAAVVRQQHPGWTAAQVRSAIVNTADQGVLKKSGSTDLESDANVIGSGRENLLAAVSAIVTVDPVSVSFGAVPAGSGRSDSRTVTLVGAPGATFGVAITAGGGGVAYSLDTGSVTLGADGTATIRVTMDALKGAAFGDHTAKLTISSGSTEVAHAVVYTFIK
jgi:subtilisin family serine protease